MDTNLARIASLIQDLAAALAQIHEGEIDHSASPTDADSKRDQSVIAGAGFNSSVQGSWLSELPTTPSSEVQPAARIANAAIGEVLEQAFADLAYRIESIDARLATIERLADDATRNEVNHGGGYASPVGRRKPQFDANGIISGVAHELDGIGIKLDVINTQLDGIGALGETLSSVGRELHEVGLRLEQIERRDAEPMPMLEALMESTARFQLLDAKLDAATFATDSLIQISEQIASLGSRFERLENEVRSMGRSAQTRGPSNSSEGDDRCDEFGEAVPPTHLHDTPHLEVLDDLPFDDSSNDITEDRWGLFRKGRASN